MSDRISWQKVPVAGDGGIACNTDCLLPDQSVFMDYVLPHRSTTDEAERHAAAAAPLRDENAIAQDTTGASFADHQQKKRSVQELIQACMKLLDELNEVDEAQRPRVKSESIETAKELAAALVHTGQLRNREAIDIIKYLAPLGNDESRRKFVSEVNERLKASGSPYRIGTEGDFSFWHSRCGTYNFGLTIKDIRSGRIIAHSDRIAATKRTCG